MDINQYITLEEAAELAGFKVPAFKWWVRNKRCPQPIKKGKLLLFLREDIADWQPYKAKAGRKKSTHQQSTALQ